MYQVWQCRVERCHLHDGAGCGSDHAAALTPCLELLNPLRVRQMEVDRLRFLLASYLRTRIAKVCSQQRVEFSTGNAHGDGPGDDSGVAVWCNTAQIKKFVTYILSNKDVFEGRLSDEEQTFCSKYADLKESHFRQSVLDQMEERLRSLEEPDMST